MRDANWDELFQRKSDDAGSLAETRLNSILPWEDWLTFAITCVLFLSVVHSVDGAEWVDDMPALYPIAFSGLLAGYAISRVRVPELLLHPFALLAGATLVFLQLLAIIPGGSAIVRTDELLDRMYVWWSAVTQDGVSSDTLPFIVLVLVLTWLGAYVTSWSIFRWRNAWLGLVPGGVTLMWNISYIPGQFSYAFVVFAFAAVMLLMRLNVARREEEWDRDGVVYPEFISLSVLNVTFWVTIALLVAVRVMPLAERSATASERWSAFTAPISERVAPLGRVFISVDSKKPIDVHNIKGALPLQGKISLNSSEAVKIDVKITPEMAAYLRAQAFDEYGANGWKLNVEGDLSLLPGERNDAAVPDAPEGARTEVTASITVQGNNDDFVYSLGQPLDASVGSTAQVGGDASDVAGLKPEGRLREGDTYTVAGSVSIASVEQLRAAGTAYPDWTDKYLQLPARLPRRVAGKAREVTRGTATPYDQAVAIEGYLRSFPNDYRVPATPPGRDAVDYFLFDVQRGYFDYHASAMAVMLRTLGVPARVAVGYVVDPLQREGEGDTYQLTERNAFAWPEVYFPGIGWVEFNPTPSQPTIKRPGVTRGTTTGTTTSQGAEEDELDLGALAGQGAGEQPTGPQETPAAAEGGADRRPMLLALGILGAFALFLAADARLAWEFGLGGMARPAQLWEKTLRLARWGGAGAKPSETPREIAARLRRDVPGAGAAGFMAALYERTTFGRKDLDDEQGERLELAWRTVRNALVRRILRRRAPAPP